MRTLNRVPARVSGKACSSVAVGSVDWKSECFMSSCVQKELREVEATGENKRESRSHDTSSRAQTDMAEFDLKSR